MNVFATLSPVFNPEPCGSCITALNFKAANHIHYSVAKAFCPRMHLPQVRGFQNFSFRLLRYEDLYRPKTVLTEVKVEAVRSSETSVPI